MKKDPYQVMDTYHEGMTRAEAWEITKDILAETLFILVGHEGRRIGQAEAYDEKKEEIRDKALQVACVHEFARAYPELYNEMLVLVADLGLQVTDNQVNGILSPEGWFLREGGAYERIVRPYVALRMQAEEQGAHRLRTVPFEETSRLNIPFSDLTGSAVDSLHFRRTVDVDDLNEAALRSMILCLNDLRHRRYEKELRGIQDDTDEFRRDVRLELFQEKVAANKRSYAIFGKHPESIPRMENGMSCVEKLIQEKFSEVKSAPVDTQAERSAEGWGVVEMNRNIWGFERDYLRPEMYSEAIESRLKSMNEELFVQYEAILDDEELVRMLHPLHSFVHRAQEATDEASLRVVAEDPNMESYLAFDRNFHSVYLCKWRYLPKEVIPEDVTQLAEAIQSWKERGYPQLLPENFDDMLKRETAVAAPHLGIFVPEEQKTEGAETLCTLEAYAEVLERGYISAARRRQSGETALQRIPWDRVRFPGPSGVIGGVSVIQPRVREENTNPFAIRPDAFGLNAELPIDHAMQRVMQNGGSLVIGTRGEVMTTDDLLFRRKHGQKVTLTPSQLLTLQSSLMGDQWGLEQGDDLSLLRQCLLKEKVLVSVKPGDTLPVLLPSKQIRIDDAA